jgi:hypothetical protein
MVFKAVPHAIGILYLLTLGMAVSGVVQGGSLCSAVFGSVAEKHLRPVHDGVIALRKVGAGVQGAAPVNAVLILELGEFSTVQSRLHLQGLSSGVLLLSKTQQLFL